MKLIRSDYDPYDGITDEYWYDDATNRLTIRRLQDVSPILDANKEQFNAHADKADYSDSKGLHMVARIPTIALEKLYRETGLNWFDSEDKDRRKFLNDGDFGRFLVRPGKL